MRRLLTCLSLLVCAHLVLATITTSQPLSTECPTIFVDTSKDFICPRGTATFTAEVRDSDPQTQLSFHWTVSAGMITSGQGSQTITVSAVDEYGHEAEEIKATVEVGGFDAACSNAASYPVRLGAFCPERKLDEYGELSFEEEKVRLENLITRLQTDENTVGLIVVYPAAGRPVGEAAQRLERARQYLVIERGLAADRIFTKNDSSRESFTVELWVMPTKLPPVTRSTNNRY